MTAAVLITGGTGFIGSRLAEACRRRGDAVRVLGQKNTPAERENADRLEARGCEVILGSVTEPREVVRAAAGCGCVYHLAAAQHEAGKSDDYFRRVNVEGTQNVLDTCCQAGVERLVHASTIGVYEALPGRTVQDDSPTRPDNIYGVTKLEAERLVGAVMPRLPAVILRISETYGPGDYRLLKLFRGVKSGRYLHLGRSNNLHHPVYIDDLVDALLLAAEAPAAPGSVLVTAGYEPVPTRRMVEEIAAALDVPSPRWTVPYWPLWMTAVAMECVLRPLGVRPPLHRRRLHFFSKSFRFAGTAGKEILGYEPRVAFTEGVRRTAQWYRKAKLL